MPAARRRVLFLESLMSAPSPTPLYLVPEGGLDALALPAAHKAWASANGFSGQRGRLLPLPGANGEIDGVLFGTGNPAGRSPFVAGLAAAALPPGNYGLAGEIGDATLAAIGFRLGAYRFDRYRESQPTPMLTLPEAADADE